MAAPIYPTLKELGIGLGVHCEASGEIEDLNIWASQWPAGLAAGDVHLREEPSSSLTQWVTLGQRRWI